jgi:hypothetical protein
MTTRPVGLVDCLLAGAQGIGNFLALNRTYGVGARSSVEQILATSIIHGSVIGMVSTLLMAVIYARLGVRAGGKATVPQAIHVLAYGGVPLAVSVGVWILTALLVGEAAFVETPQPGADGFLLLLVYAQFASYVLLLVWSIVLQVMGLSELWGCATRRAFALWVAGQIIGALASVILAVIIDTAFPGVLQRFIPQR